MDSQYFVVCVETKSTQNLYLPCTTEDIVANYKECWNDSPELAHCILHPIASLDRKKAKLNVILMAQTAFLAAASGERLEPNEMLCEIGSGTTRILRRRYGRVAFSWFGRIIKKRLQSVLDRDVKDLEDFHSSLAEISQTVDDIRLHMLLMSFSKAKTMRMRPVPFKCQCICPIAFTLALFLMGSSVIP